MSKREFISDKEIKKLEKVKKLLTEIKELDSEFSISNVLEIDKDTILVFRIKDTIFKQEFLDTISRELCDSLNVKCLVLPQYILLEKALNKRKYLYDNITRTIKIV